MAQPQQQQQYPHNQQHHGGGGRGGGGRGRGRYNPTGMYGGHQQHHVTPQLIGAPRQPQQQMVFPQGVQFYIPGQQNIMQYGGLPQQQQPQYPMAYQNVLVRPHNQLYQPPTNTFQPTAAAFIPSTDQSQSQGLFRQPQKPVQQPAAQQQTQQQPLKREKKALLIINPDTNKPINVDTPTTNKAPSKSPEPEPLAPLVSPTTDAKREFQQKIVKVSTKPSSVSSKAGSLDDKGVQLSQVLPGGPSQPLQISNVNLQQPTHTPLLSNLSDKTKVDTPVEKKVDVDSENKEPGKEAELEIADVPKPVEEPQVIQQPPEMTREPPHSPPPEVKPVKETTLEEKVSMEVVAESKEPDPSPTSLPTETSTIPSSTDAPTTSLPPDATPQSHSTGLHADAAPITLPTDQTEVPSDVVPVGNVLEHQVPSEETTEGVEEEETVEESKPASEELEGLASQLLESEETSPPEPQHEDQNEEVQVESEPSVEPDEEEVEEEAVDTEEKEEGEISDESTDDGQDEPTSKRTCTVQSDHPPQRDSSGRLKYDREYLLSFRFLKECKEPPKELMFSDSTLLELIRRSKHDDPSLRRDAFLPPFSQAGVKRQSKDRGRSNRGNQGPHPRVIEIEVEKVELSKSENAWKRATEVTVKLSEEEKETSELYRKFQGILNKLTPQKFQKLAEQAKELAEKMDTPERMSGCIEKIFIKALEEPVFSVAYAKLCLVLTPYKVQVTGEDGQLKMKSFRALLLTKCQQEFEKDKKEDEDLEKLKAAIEAAKSEDDKKARKDEYDAAEFKSRHRSLGNIRFIGELFKFKLLSEAIIHECIQRLLKSTSDGESLECFAKLMTTIGKELDHDKGQNLMDRYFGRVDHIIEANKIGSRVKFMLQDVVDLRKNTWVPRKIVASNVPTTIDKLHADHHQQAEEMKRILSVQPNRPRQPPGDNRRRDDYQSDGRRVVQQPHAPEKLETDRLRRLGNRPQETTTKRLGPSTWSTKQAQQPQARSEPQKVESTKYGGRSSKGKKTAGPAPSGSRRSATQLIATEAKKQQKDVIAAVALQTGYKVQPTPVVSDALSEEDVEKKSGSLYAELCSNLDYKEALLCVSEMRSPGKLHKLVFAVLNASMEKTSKCRHTAGVLFDRLVKEGHLSSESLLKGLNELLEFAEDLECDLPKFWDYVAEVLAPPVVGGGLPLADLKQAHDQVLQSGKMGKLVAKTLQKCTTLEKISQDHVSRIWSESGLDWTSDLRVEPSDVQYLVEDHSLQFLSHSSPPAIQVHSGVSHDKQQEWIHRLQLKLSSSEDTNDDVVSFIEKHHSEHCHSPPFIYCLSCAFINAGVSGSGDNVVYKTDLLERRCPVLKHFVDHHSNLQIDIIYGLQVTLSKKQHPKGILDKLFTLLYEHDVIGEDTFMLWEEGGREDLEGRGVALMSAKPFMEWLRSVDSQEGQ